MCDVSLSLCPEMATAQVFTLSPHLEKIASRPAMWSLLIGNGICSGWRLAMSTRPRCHSATCSEEASGLAYSQVDEAPAPGRTEWDDYCSVEAQSSRGRATLSFQLAQPARCSLWQW